VCSGPHRVASLLNETEPGSEGESQVKSTLDQSVKAQKGSRVIALHFLQPRR
jgi:hypothetical protein